MFGDCSQNISTMRATLLVSMYCPLDADDCANANEQPKHSMRERGVRRRLRRCGSCLPPAAEAALAPAPAPSNNPSSVVCLASSSPPSLSDDSEQEVLSSHTFATGSGLPSKRAAATGGDTYSGGGGGAFPPPPPPPSAAAAPPAAPPFATSFNMTLSKGYGSAASPPARSPNKESNTSSSISFAACTPPVFLGTHSPTKECKMEMNAMIAV